MPGKVKRYRVEPITDIRDMFFKSSSRFASRPALLHKVGNQWRSISYEELKDRVEDLATGLIELGMGKGDKVAILGENRPEWAETYLAVSTSGSTCVPIDRDLKQQEIFHILFLSEAKFIVASGKYMDLLDEIRPRLPHLKVVVNMDAEERAGDVYGFPEVMALGHKARDKGNREYQGRTIDPDDLLAIIFTSGTTGASKGVMLSHRNVTSNMMATCMCVYMDETDRVLSVLPLHHTYECTDGFLIPLYRGGSIAYCENLRRIADNLAETKASCMLGVPALYEAMYKKVLEGIEQKGRLKFAIGKAVAGLSEKVLRLDLRRKIFDALHRKLGGRLRLFISGGAPIDPQVGRGFRELGITFLQGYGLTEASPILTVNPDSWVKDGSVGLPLPNVELRVEDGEILARGPNIMLGYYRNPQATAEAIRDGWLHTGDLGYFDKDGFLYIHGRKKSMIVLPGGKKVFPEEVEAELLKSPYIQECLVWGGPEEDPSQVEVQAIIVPNMERFSLEFESKGEQLSREKMEAVLREEIKRRCSNLANYKRVKKFTIREEEFDKTTTRKIKRYLYTGKPQQVTTRK